MPTLTVARPPKFERSHQKYEAVIDNGWREVPVAPGKMLHNGIEVPDSLSWQKWEPGREYIKHIVLKNIKVKTEKIKYHVPSTRFFSTLYPKTIMLSAGTSFTLPVTFRPLEKIEYRDKIVFHSKEGTFEVNLCALLPLVELTIPERLEFPMCAAQDSVKLLFEVKNTGDLPTTFQWESTDPFLIQPLEATLQPQSACTVKATFQPRGASVYEATVMCCYGPNFSLHKEIQLFGIGKYPHLLVVSPGSFDDFFESPISENIVDFGLVPIGQSAEKWVELRNLAPVSAPYQVDHAPGIQEIDSVFYCPQTHGVVPAFGCVKIPLLYSPNTVETISTDYFHVKAIGNVSKTVVKCVGASKGSCVELSSKIVNFMQINTGDLATRTVTIYNLADTEAKIQILIDCNESVFQLEETCFTMKPQSEKRLILHFVPKHPINYYRRLTCLVHNQGPLFLDLLGTCHSELVKPAVLLEHHIDRYWTHVNRGYSLYSPEQLNDMLEKNQLEIDQTGAIAAPQGEEEDCTVLVGQGDITPMEEYFNDGFHTDIMNGVPHVSLDTNKADFGCCQNLRIVEDKIVNMTNHTKGKITVQWITDTSRLFSVSPSSIDIPPHKSVAFQVAFKPNAPNQFYGSELECYVYYKSLRDYRLTEDVTHCPPWCLTLTCVGQTFMPNNETFLPRYILDPQGNLVFPAVNCNEAIYRTVLLTNTGPTPILFDIQDTTQVFSVKPSKGMLKSGDHQIFVVKTLPVETRTYKHSVKIGLNDSPQHEQELCLRSSAEVAEVLLETNGEMFFKPTCLGTTSSRFFNIKNISRMPLRFEWKLNYSESQLLSVSPDSGIIQPNESLSQCWQFSPASKEKYLMKPVLVAWGQGHSLKSSAGKKRYFPVRVIGEGTEGEIKCEEGYVNLGDVLIGKSASTQLVLFNNGDCALHYNLHMEESIDDDTAETTEETNTVLTLDVNQGTLQARSRQCVNVTVTPRKRASYQFAISYELLPSPGCEKGFISPEPQYLCHLLVTGVFPCLSITDARCQGSASGISKKQLWNLFSLDNLNVCLDADPSPMELKFTKKTRASLQRRISTYTRAILDMNFSAAPVGSEPCEVTLLVENTGTVNAGWSFLFPSDLQMDIDHWAETGQLDDDELHEMKVMQNNLFSVEPKHGELSPGESQSVTLTYKHIMAGTDRLPVLLKLVNGREILLNFIGVTVDADRRYIHFPANKHSFSPVPVGEKISPKQIYEIYNGGALPVCYQLDLTSLQILCKENYNQPVLECMNPSGELRPGKSAQIEWRFSPIEAKTYMVDVPIHVEGGDTAVITFSGIGYDKRVMGSTMKMSDDPEIENVPSKQSVAVPGQLAYLSQDRVSLGNLPLFSQARRMVSVTNRSRDHKVSFQWHVTSRRDAKFLSIYPICGRLEAGESQLCRVCFTAYGDPSFYDLDLVCEIVDETVFAEYKKSLTAWETEQTRQKHEFTITEKDLTEEGRRRSADSSQNRPRSGQLTALEEENRSKATEAELVKYKTLPPIKTLSCDERRRQEREKKRLASIVFEKPTAPVPFLLHLGVTARTHDVKEFQDNFPDTYREFFIDRALSEKSCRDSNERAVIPSEIPCLQAEGEIITGILNNILRGLMDDPYFQDGIKKIGDEPVPYFVQYCPVNNKKVEEINREDTMEESDSSFSLPERTSRGLTPRLEMTPSSPETSPPHTPCSSRISQETQKVDPTAALQGEKDLQEKQDLKKLAEFGNLSETVLENTLMNIMCEALSGEFRITAKPRFIALPSRQGSANTRSSKH